MSEKGPGEPPEKEEDALRCTICQETDEAACTCPVCDNLICIDCLYEHAFECTHEKLKAEKLKAAAAATAAAAAAAPPPRTLTTDDLQRIAENKEKALQKRTEARLKLMRTNRGAAI